MNETYRANRVLGNTLRFSGWLLQIVGGLSWALGTTWLLLYVVWSYGVAGLVQMFALLIGGSVAIAVGRPLARRGRRYTARVYRSIGEIPQPYVLYLRPFDVDAKTSATPYPHSDPSWNYRRPSDRTHEEELARYFSPFGQMVAVGHPTEQLAFSGAAKIYLPLDNWKPSVSKLIRRANLLVLAAGTTESTLWELTEAARLKALSRLVILLYGDPDAYDDFRAAVPAAFARRAREAAGIASLAPEFPAPDGPIDPGSSVPEPLIWGAIRFREDGGSEFHRFDLSALGFVGRLFKSIRGRHMATLMTGMLHGVHRNSIAMPMGRMMVHGQGVASLLSLLVIPLLLLGVSPLIILSVGAAMIPLGWVISYPAMKRLERRSDHQDFQPRG